MNETPTENEDTMSPVPMTSMKVKAATRDKLAEIGKKTESFDDIINRLLEYYETHHKERD